MHVTVKDVMTWRVISTGENTRFKDGVVTLSGRMTLHKDAQIALWVTRQVNGVVDVIDELAWDRDPSSEAV
jgi:osmotically-inducible protein OsmY